MSTPKKSKNLKSFLVSVGGSKAPVGFCMRVRAETKEQAVETVQRVLPAFVDAIDFLYDDSEFTMGAVEYFNVYFNENALTVADIDDSETGDVEDEDAEDEDEEG